MKRQFWMLGAIGAIAATTLASGVVVVAPGEVAVVRRFGRALPAPWGPGLHCGWPPGIDRVDRIRADEVRRLTVGRAGASVVGDEPGAGEFLTGDANLLRAEATLQYRVSSPVAFLTRQAEVEPILTRLAEAGLSRALAGQGIDASLRDRRAAAAREAEAEVARGAERYGLGVAVLGLSLTDARPPSEVAPDFAAAQAARSDRDRRLNEARAYSESTITRARAEANARLERGRARADRLLTVAKGRSSRFLSLQAEAARSRELTVKRLYLDAVRDLWAKARRKIVLAPDEPLDLSIIEEN